MVVITCCQIWKDRCRKVFKRKSPDPIKSMRKIQAVTEELMKIESEMGANEVRNGKA